MVCYKFEYKLTIRAGYTVEKNPLYNFKYESKMKIPALHTSITYSYSVSKYIFPYI